MDKREKLYEGKAKIVYSTDDPSLIIQYFKDDATAFNAEKRGTIVGKGVVNNLMSAAVFEMLGRRGVPTHYVRTLSDREMLCRRLDIIKIETIVRNVVAGSLAKRLGPAGGHGGRRSRSSSCYYKYDALGDPLINDDHVRMLGLGTPRELACDQALGARRQRRARAVAAAAAARAGRLQARVRPPQGPALARRRGQPRHLPALGRANAGEARQGPLPARPGRRGGSLPGGVPPGRRRARHEEGGRVKARVLVRLKPGILDAQGRSVQRALVGLGFGEVAEVRVGKVVDLELDGLDPAAARARIDQMCGRLLVNPVIEDFTVELVS